MVIFCVTADIEQLSGNEAGCRSFFEEDDFLVSVKDRGVIVQWIRHFSVFFSQSFFSLTMFDNPEKHLF